jgi:hypothetical protein
MTDTIYLKADPFAKAVEALLIAATQATDENGLKLAVHPTPFRAAMEVREAIKRMSGFDVVVKDWQNLLRQMKVPYPGLGQIEEPPDAA